MSYTILHEGRAILCHQCGRTSWNPGDVRHLYCGFCHGFHEEGDTRPPDPPDGERPPLQDGKA